MSLKDTLRVMVVDDMSVSRGLLTQALEEIGIWKVDAQNSGQSALSRLAASPVHLVISDFNMPGMDGLQLLEGLRSNRSTQQIGFILVTGTPTQEIVDKGRRLGLNNLVKKPFTTASLKQSIEAVVGRL
ncbi:response regulator [Wenxinia marina]|uniref:Response regulator n=1 Tax=Wenxinia marina DSM 24838 TaxID=1123501 RepID=A0A0D0Q8E7_9RHOB|nr:response regulator [Wenxinia marina]KIQ67403.1 Response regulator [Wenxinia marina DSM 24838]GGL69761.1 response regulator [Wenxinia marina]